MGDCSQSHANHSWRKKNPMHKLQKMVPWRHSNEHPTAQVMRQSQLGGDPGSGSATLQPSSDERHLNTSSGGYDRGLNPSLALQPAAFASTRSRLRRMSESNDPRLNPNLDSPPEWRRVSSLAKRFTAWCAPSPCTAHKHSRSAGHGGRRRRRRRGRC